MNDRRVIGDVSERLAKCPGISYNTLVPHNGKGEGYMGKSSPQKREDLRQLFERNGLLAYEDWLLLGQALRYCASDDRVVMLIKKLINTCDHPTRVFDLPLIVQEELGLNLNERTLLKLVPTLCRRYYQCSEKPQSKRGWTNEEIQRMLFPYFIGKNEEHVLLLLADNKWQILYCDFVSKGTTFSSDINFSGILQLVAKYEARYVVLAHNHPSGIAAPSLADIESTRKLQNALKVLGCHLWEHGIFAEGAFCAMSSLEELADLFT